MRHSSHLSFLTFIACSLLVASKDTYFFSIFNTWHSKTASIDVTTPDPVTETTTSSEFEIVFRLYTRENLYGYRFTWTLNSIKDSSFNSNNPVRILIHGWQSNCTSEFNTVLVNSYLQRGEYNVIGVDWGTGADTISYGTARNRVPAVAHDVAKLLSFLVNHELTALDNLVIVGHSLGTHIAGLTGKIVKRAHGCIKAIIALDPAGPNFSLDFYVNWGKAQPGCSMDIVCSHGRAYMYFAESLLVNEFIGVNCLGGFKDVSDYGCKHENLTGSMGGDIWSTGLRGVYLLRTNEKSPFARGWLASDLGCINNTKSSQKIISSSIASVSSVLPVDNGFLFSTFMTDFLKKKLNDFYFDQTVGPECYINNTMWLMPSFLIG